MSEVIIFEENSLFGLKSNTGEVLLQPNFTSLVSCRTNIYLQECWDFAFYYIALVRTKIGDKYALYDYKGNLALPPIYNKIVHAHGNYFIIIPDWGTGVFEIGKGEIVPTEYESVSCRGELFIVQRNGKLGVYCNNGKVVCDVEFDDIKITEELILGRNCDNIIIHDLNGKTLFNSYYEITDYVYGKWSDFYIVRRNGFYGCLNRSPWYCESLEDVSLLKELVPCIYDYIAYTDKTIFDAKINDKDMFIKYFVKKGEGTLSFYQYDLYDINDNPAYRGKTLLSTIITDTFCIQTPSKTTFTNMNREFANIYENLKLTISQKIDFEGSEDDLCIEDASFIMNVLSQLEIERGYVLGLYPHGYSLGTIESNYRNYYTMPYVHKENATKYFSPELKSTQPPKKTWLQRLHLAKCEPWEKEYYSSEEYSPDMLIPELLIDVLAKSVPSPLEYVRLNREEEAIWEVFLLDKLKHFLPTFNHGNYIRKNLICVPSDIDRLPNYVKDYIAYCCRSHDVEKIFPKIEFSTEEIMVKCCYFNQQEGLIMWKTSYRWIDMGGGTGKVESLLLPFGCEDVLVPVKEIIRY